MERESQRRSSPFRIWLLPFSLLLGSSIVVFAISFALDAYDETSPGAVAGLILNPNAESALGAISNAAEVVAAVPGVAGVVDETVVPSVNQYGP